LSIAPGEINRDGDLRSSQNQFALILWIPQAPLPHNSHDRLSNLFSELLIDCEITSCRFPLSGEFRNDRKNWAFMAVGTRIEKLFL
jgi:hypothetical protein